LIERAMARWCAAPAIEITLEANPTSIESDRFAAFRDGGVNRVSIGVQSLDPAALRFLGRQHDVAQARGALALARKVFDRVSFDLIYARPGQSDAAWRAELTHALDLAGDHLSLYQLTIEPMTGFEGRVRRGELIPMASDDAAGLYETTQAIME